MILNFRLAVNNFQTEANKVQFDMLGDSAEAIRMSKQLLKWDRKKKKMITVNPVCNICAI